MKPRLLVLILALDCSLALAQESFSSLEEQMTGKEFTAAGLDKLTEDELAALNDWLRAHSVATLEEARQPVGDTRGFETATMGNLDASDVVSRIQGTFSGWDGDTVFVLENGMIWKQAESGRFYISPVEDPVVTIERGLFRSWRLSVEGYNETVQVERIQ